MRRWQIFAKKCSMQGIVSRGGGRVRVWIGLNAMLRVCGSRIDLISVSDIRIVNLIHITDLIQHLR